MTIAEQIIRAKADYDKVYTAGYDKGKSEGGNTEEAYNEGLEAGKQAERSDFWDIFQNNGNRKDYNKAFFSVEKSSNGWNDRNYNPKYPIIIGSQSTPQLFWACPITDTKVPIIVRDNASAYGLFGSSAVHTVRKLVLEGTVFSWQNAFIDCGSLENITIEGTIYTSLSFSSCSKLTHDSLINIINVLNDYSGTTTTQTLTLHATAKARLSDEEKAIATQKGWTIA